MVEVRKLTIHMEAVMAGKYIPFEQVEELADIERLAQMLNLPVRKSGVQLRCPCPVHGGDRGLAITPSVRSRRGSLGVFYCQEAKEGGDRIGLVAHCMEMSQQDAAFFIHSQFGDGNSEPVNSNTVSNSRATAPQNDRRAEPTAPKFDPDAFLSKLQVPEGMSEEDAKTFRVGVHRGALYVPAVYPSGIVAGWWKLQDGKLTPPREWLPDSAKVVPLRRPA